AITNKSPNQLISSVRLQYAKELLLDQENTVAEIAFRTGFSSPSYFSKCFKKEFSVSPSELVS
uniref:helix-turn-helix domain-containing protein n=1 Tax=uncultured Aquimarina sp. TaxID=575652 RepID=UPI002631CB41